MSAALARFISAQEQIYERVRGELRDGQKSSHWMWFIFPQIAGLGFSEMSRRYAIRDIDEAREYLRHPVLGRRLVECAMLVLSHKARSIHDILGSPDDVKLKSCMTLFEKAAPTNSLFASVLEQFYNGDRDERTVQLLGEIN